MANQDWEPQEPFEKKDFVKFVKELSNFLPTEPKLIQSLLDDTIDFSTQKRMWNHVRERMGNNLLRGHIDIFLYEMSLFYKLYYSFKKIKSVNYETHHRKKQASLDNLKQQIIMSKYDCEREYMYRYMYLDPSNTIKNLIKKHNEIKEYLSNLDYKFPNKEDVYIDGLLQYYSFNKQDLSNFNQNQQYRLTNSMKIITRLYVNICIALKSLYLPNYIILWILGKLDYDSEYFLDEHTGRRFVFEGFDPTRRKDTNVYIFDCLSQLQKIRIIEMVQSFEPIASRLIHS